MSVCVKVVIDDIVSKIDKPYTYRVPEALSSLVQSGKRIIVPFSNANIKKKAFIFNVFESDDTEGLKEVISILDDDVIVTDMQMSLVELLKTRYFTTYYRALKSIIPRGVDFKVKEHYKADKVLENVSAPLYKLICEHKGTVTYSDIPKKLRNLFDKCVSDGLIKKEITTSRNVGELSEKRLSLSIDQSELESYICKLDHRFSKQKDLLSVFLDYNELSLKDALYYSGCSVSTVKTLERKGIIKITEQPIDRNPYKDILRAQNITHIDLSDEQQIAFDSISSDLDKYKTHLIYGVTGSGKTLVYISLIDKLFKDGKSVIFMVPEISLTPQTLERFYSRYGDLVAIVHSGLTPGERADEWYKIKNSSQSIIVGTRSAVFSPVNNLGAIIIDEEHEPSYKSESTPRYHVRDISKFICKKLNIPLILGSATPSVESNYYAKKGIYSYHILKKRFNNNPLPRTEIIDMRESFKDGNQSFLSERLRESISENLEKSEQTILFLNRRGTHTLIGCRSCGYVEKCPNCGIGLTYHSANNRCMCHYCGYSVKLIDKCPECGGKHIKMLGVGTQLVCTELEEMFPDARILRMDFDTVGSYIEYGKKLNSFKNGDYDIMLGTQMVAKGLDFPNVTLVGVINADLSLYVDDFRANERTFSLLTQVCGRSGRAGKEGIAIIQTYSPEYEIIQYSKAQNYNDYYDFEISFRKAMNYPPFCDLIRFTVTSESDNTAYKDVMDLYNYVNELSVSEYSDIPIRMLYPTAPKIAKFNNKYRYNLVIKSRACSRLYELLYKIQEEFDNNKRSDVSINVNPIGNI